MRRRGALALALVLFASTDTASAVYEVVEIQKPFVARNLSGVALDPNGEPVSGVEVAECDSEFQNVLATTMSDEEGRFHFPHAELWTTHYLKFKANGFNPLWIRVKLRPFATKSVNVKLPIGG